VAPLHAEVAALREQVEQLAAQQDQAA
jgi:hypothetical protein